MSDNKRAIGDICEDIAVKYLEDKNITIIKRNYKKNNGEIDIISKENEVIVFTEVKYRRNKNFGSPLEAITEKKLKKILATADLFLQQNNMTDKEVRFDAISILKIGDFLEIEHIENILGW